MRMLWQVIVGLLVIHFLAAAGFVGWLYNSGRLDTQRYHRVVEMFKLTMVQEEADVAEAERLAEQEIARQETARRLESAKAGPVTLRDRLTSRRQIDERAQLRLDRLDRAKADIRSQIELARNTLAKEQQKLDAAKQQFDAFVAQRTAQWQDEDFQQAVALLQKQDPQQAKAVFQTLLARGEEEQVVDYLAAMPVRQAAKVLAEFQTGPEVNQMTQLIELLRMRGGDSLLDTLANPSAERDL